MSLPTCNVKGCAKYQFLEEIDDSAEAYVYRNLELLALVSYM